MAQWCEDFKADSLWFFFFLFRYKMLASALTLCHTVSMSKLKGRGRSKIMFYLYCSLSRGRIFSVSICQTPLLSYWSCGMSHMAATKPISVRDNELTIVVLEK